MGVHNPNKLTDQEWADEIQSLHFIRTQERKASEAQIPSQ